MPASKSNPLNMLLTSGATELDTVDRGFSRASVRSVIGSLFCIVIFFSFVLFSISFSFLFYFYFYDDFFVYFTYMLSNDVPKRRTLHSSRISNIIDSNDI